MVEIREIQHQPPGAPRVPAVIIWRGDDVGLAKAIANQLGWQAEQDGTPVWYEVIDGA